jgi:hypothetical protein
MNLNELEITKEIRTERLVDVIEKYGWHLLGQGIEGNVAEHPQKNYVLKIWPRSSKYGKFVEFCQHHQNNPHVPQFSRFTRPVPGTSFSYVRMEKLTPVSTERLVNGYKSELIYLWLWGKMQGVTTLTSDIGDEIREIIADEGIFVGGLTSLEDDLHDLWAKFGWPEPSWIKICEELVAYAKQQGYSFFDLHTYNFMTRNGYLVILDPFF